MRWMVLRGRPTSQARGGSQVGARDSEGIQNAFTPQSHGRIRDGRASEAGRSGKFQRGCRRSGAWQGGGRGRLLRCFRFLALSPWTGGDFHEAQLKLQAGVFAAQCFNFIFLFPRLKLKCLHGRCSFSKHFIFSAQCLKLGKELRL